MPIAFSCSCGRVLRVRDEMAGKKARCPGCNAVAEVPAAADPEAEVPDEAPPGEHDEGVTTSPRPSQRRRAVWPVAGSADDDEDAPRIRRARRPRDIGVGERLNPSLFLGMGMMAFAVVLAVGLLFLDVFSCWTVILFIGGLVTFIRGVIAAVGAE